MKVVLQRVARASVTVGGDVVGRIGRGYCLLVGFTHADGDAEVEWMAEKISGLRLFPDDEGKMNRDLREAGGSFLVVSQFTLYGDVAKGRRPSFGEAARLRGGDRPLRRDDGRRDPERRAGHARDRAQRRRLIRRGAGLRASARSRSRPCSRCPPPSRPGDRSSPARRRTRRRLRRSCRCCRGA
jgi:D-tyrosyl-tRNA(Tyr) deacylase